MNDKQSFWTTIPGILTGAAAVITAIGGLLLTLSQTGVLGSKNRDATIAKKVEIETVDRVASNGLSADKSSADENLIAVAGQESISADDQSMSREPSAPMTGEINLILADNGGQILAATSDAWLRTIDGEESGFVFNESGLGAKTEAVFAFKDERAATFYKFTVPIFKTMDENIIKTISSSLFS